jgi:hypothetical protein
MTVRVKLKVKWHWYGEKLADLWKLDFEVILGDVIGVDSVAVVEELTMSKTLMARNGVYGNSITSKEGEEADGG